MLTAASNKTAAFEKLAVIFGILLSQKKNHGIVTIRPEKVQRRTLASGTYPNALLPFHGTGVARSSSRNRRLRTPRSPRHVVPLPTYGSGYGFKLGLHRSPTSLPLV